MDNNNITVLGVGNILYTDDGVGIRVVEKLEKEYEFSENIDIIDGGVLGVNLLGVISNAGRLIVVDTVLNHAQPGDLHRLDHDQIPNRILAKNSLHQVDLIEALTLCNALDHVPQTTIIGIEPKDIETLNEHLTPEIGARLDDLVQNVLEEVLRLGGSFQPRA
ncbi:hydrogenase expression/formation protein [Desulfobacter hydrogenophilus]|uniref:HyaD/HybD family hydrogenase maturation endopeptidase n=1 Tax=Desulfobacter hydrogenophilus TaxID=2291 RepID=A0A328FAC8_9BACT|nr:HyaD/HybD family hydrogenase maturation endopeptidase [Desulfobacter hydrogenophilus]NDY73928.1 HyaD/HybD family hydrogenase maturation endopeptidase [Desulfobacter hydrogenophilus]QBH12090.1 HyaD/HybD family hydrogenase maturation endopeptidase [Desulfobacter hydrogenophilus]RAM00372.1 hydrogenase expression/formation protein [Desulfobacter hydrogenophilus]